jgi:hypothetical protein
MHQKQLYRSLPQESRALGPETIRRDRIKVNNFSKAMLGEPPFRSILLYRDEDPFTRKSIVNSYNIFVSAEEKPQAIVEQDHQQQFRANVWCDICDFQIGRTYFLHS